MAKKNKSSEDKKNNEEKVELFSQLSASARYSRTLLSRQLLSCGLYAGQDAVILALDANDGLSLSAIAEQLGVRAPTMTKTINRLAAQGFVDKRESETDARLSHVYLTEAGHDAVKSVRKAIRKSQKIALQELSVKDVKSLMRLLKKVEHNIASALG
ncbi:MarR family winged helix-turn-helix transcriptional regulator [Hoeflea poritis]|uniref:MarR family transcriptional regulator n=1 Tax=Hoeflea poritis TaxID=2993659 RepID=A0ABT4VR58_9HYPH|nr:MarR family transcriptional regulator [Hoeflea poritis]MDA4847195.1 MarR family transcriptional regulator [Hoeflea poritis]